MDGNYVVMLRESLERKVAILDEIIQLNEQQKDILRDANADPDDLEDNIEKKGRLVEELNQLDDGFQILFNEVEAILQKSRSMFAGEIETMKALIEMITDKSTRVSVQEKENYDMAKVKFSDIRTQIQKVKKSQQAVNTYYKNMMKVNYLDPQFMDNKK